MTAGSPVTWLVMVPAGVDGTMEPQDVPVVAHSVAGSSRDEDPLIFWNETRVVAVFPTGAWSWVREVSAIPTLLVPDTIPEGETA